MPKAKCQMVNGSSGGGYVNHCEQALDDKNAMVMATSKITGNGDQTVTTVANTGAYSSLDTSEMVSFKQYVYTNLMMIDEYKAEIKENNEKIKLSKEVQYLIHKLEKRLAEILVAARDDSLDVLPFTPVSSTCSSGMGDMSSVELQEYYKTTRSKT